MKVYQQLSSSLDAMNRCKKNNNSEWFERHQERIEEIIKAHLPHGSGFDSGCELCFETSKPNRLVILTAFHHMNDSGFYDGWTEHKVIITPTLAADFNLKITGPDRNQIKDYISETFHAALSEEVTR